MNGAHDRTSLRAIGGERRRHRLADDVARIAAPLQERGQPSLAPSVGRARRADAHAARRRLDRRSRCSSRGRARRPPPARCRCRRPRRRELLQIAPLPRPRRAPWLMHELLGELARRRGSRAARSARSTPRSRCSSRPCSASTARTSATESAERRQPRHDEPVDALIALGAGLLGLRRRLPRDARARRPRARCATPTQAASTRRRPRHPCGVASAARRRAQSSGRRGSSMSAPAAVGVGALRPRQVLTGASRSTDASLSLTRPRSRRDADRQAPLRRACARWARRSTGAARSGGAPADRCRASPGSSARCRPRCRGSCRRKLRAFSLPWPSWSPS